MFHFSSGYVIEQLLEVVLTKLDRSQEKNEYLSPAAVMLLTGQDIEEEIKQRDSEVSFVLILFELFI